MNIWFGKKLNIKVKWLVLSHSMARANLNKSVWLVTNTTTASKYIPRRTRISINWNPSFQTSLHKIFKYCFLWSKSCSHLEVLLLSKFGSERGTSFDGDSGPLWYVLWCCGGICHQPDAFIQIGSGHTVPRVNVNFVSIPMIGSFQ